MTKRWQRQQELAQFRADYQRVAQTYQDALAERRAVRLRVRILLQLMVASGIDFTGTGIPAAALALKDELSD